MDYKESLTGLALAGCRVVTTLSEPAEERGAVCTTGESSLGHHPATPLLEGSELTHGGREEGDGTGSILDTWSYDRLVTALPSYNNIVLLSWL